jgi:cell division protein FtsL
MLKKILASITIIIVFLIIINLIRQISDALNTGKRLDSSVEEVNSLQEENNRLQKQLNQVGEYAYLEKIARDKLSLAKPGETIVVISDSALNRVLNPPKPPEPPKIPNWQGWLNLIFH